MSSRNYHVHYNDNLKKLSYIYLLGYQFEKVLVMGMLEINKMWGMIPTHDLTEYLFFNLIKMYKKLIVFIYNFFIYIKDYSYSK